MNMVSLLLWVINFAKSIFKFHFSQTSKATRTISNPSSRKPFPGLKNPLKCIMKTFMNSPIYDAIFHNQKFSLHKHKHN